MLFTSPRKLFLFSRYLSICLDFLVMHRKGFIKKIKVSFKFYDDTAWLKNNCNTLITQYFEMPDDVCLQQFSVSCICNNDLMDFNRGVSEPCCSTGFSYVFSLLLANQCFLNSRF